MVPKAAAAAFIFSPLRQKSVTRGAGSANQRGVCVLRGRGGAQDSQHDLHPRQVIPEQGVGGGGGDKGLGLRPAGLQVQFGCMTANLLLFPFPFLSLD